MKHINLVLLALTFVIVGHSAHSQKVKTDNSGNFYAVSERDPKLLNLSIDERGLISCTFKEGEDTLAYDYLKRSEFDSVFHLTNTGKTYTDSKGTKHVVYESKKGGLFIWMVSKKTGNAYKVTIKPE